MYSSSNIYLDNCSAEHLHSFQLDPTLSTNSDGLGTSMPLNIDIGSKRILPQNTYYSSNALGSSLISSSQAELNSSPSQGSTVGPLSTRRCLSPVASSWGPHECPLKSGHQAKRTRVENIIKGMTGSPSMHFADVAMKASQHEESDNIQENKRTREVPHHHDHVQRSGAGVTGHWSPENQTIRRQLQSRHMPIRKLLTRVSQEDEENESEVSEESFVEENYPTLSDSRNASLSDTFKGRYNEFETLSSRKCHGGKRVKLMNYLQSKPDRVNALMADILKYELSRAVSTSVDSIFKSIPFLQRSPNVDWGEETVNPNQAPLNLHQQSSICEDNKCCEGTEVQVPEVQTEALSLVVQKPPQARSCAVNLLPITRGHHRPKPQFPFSHHIALHKDQASENIQNSPQNNTLRFYQDGYPGVGQPKLEPFDVSWNSVKARSKVNSRSIRSPQAHPIAVDPMLLESLCLPHVKIESDGLPGIVKDNLFVLNEGLTTNHLKKAKLMFFYTRYPSSLVLKTFFHDVQFTRCITSQLIKWFSNFREFYYIQMEKYARHAIMEGLADVRDLSVGRESELFRALNMHYNKANDFQVPDRFLEVAEITLREFYIAISMGKDGDPSWKKAIYKVICKMDSDVPDEFRSLHSA
ncbi:prospero homeobox protein 2-like [Polymixia lowei]